MCVTVGCLAASCICRSCIAAPNRMVARYIYGIFFLLCNLLAWMARDYGSSSKNLNRALVHYFKSCRGGFECLGSDGVLRLSFGCFIFFLLMYLTTVGTSSTNDIRDAWHAGWWPIKSLLWVALMVVPFLIPSSFIQYYGEIARFGAGIFLMIQLLSVINFIYFWNEDWLSERNEHCCRMPMVITSILSYVVSLFANVVMYIWFAPYFSCKLNIFFITWTLVLILLMTTISLHSKVNAGLLTSGIMTVYVVFLCWSAIMSEPDSAVCNTQPRQTGKGDWLTIVEFAVGFCAIVLATFTTGTDSKSFSITRKDWSEMHSNVPYSYGFFHFVFAMGAMYFAMLFVGWSPHQTMDKWSMDVGWTSVWVKVVNEWIAAAVYVWTMIAPLVLKNRNFS
ncbi:unnamed protein product [Sphagnum troendelagicum]|uniref:Serine incorporator n=1 Tax=Sphagnum troendelagicum TaxID=128251 RepID=A0ABP0U1L9_9BRYO